MGRNNQKRRRHKLRRKEDAARDANRDTRATGGSRGAHRGDHGTPASGTARDQVGFDDRTVEVLLHDAAVSYWAQDGAVNQAVGSQLARAWTEVPERVATVAATMLTQVVRTAWTFGWQPGDLPRLMARRGGPRHGRLCTVLIGLDAERYRDRTDADPAWIDQLDEIGAPSTSDGAGSLFPVWLERERIDPVEGLQVVTELLAHLWHLQRIPTLIDPPDQWGRPGARARQAPDHIDHKILTRVRALLTKAESTTFPDEADALTTKAQELMTRYAIDRAVVEGTERSEAQGRRIGIDDPYASAKSILLSAVAAATRCRAVWSGPLGFSTVFGFPTDLEVVEILFTSLLVQATRAMTAAGNKSDNARLRSRQFRQSFLVSFAIRIDQRLSESAETTVAEAAVEYGSALLPVLASRLDAVEELCDEVYPELTRQSLSANDPAGWSAGAIAADQASLAVGAEVERT